MSGYELKVIYSIQLNVEYLIKRYGLEYCGFLTLTFGDHVTDWREGQRRLHSFMSGWARKRLLEYMCVLEFMKIGRIHYHLLPVLEADIRTGVNFEEIKNGNYKSAGKYLRGLWKELREVLPKYGFGRHELMPIKSNAEGMAKYASKYISKSVGNREHCKGARFVRYSQEWKAASVQFAWNNDNAKLWRTRLSQVAKELDFHAMSDFKIRFGPHWAYFLAPAIMTKKAS
ncbi:MAG: hypothetical protein PHI84_18155 [Kiritimatiellae bacterium]|nr:hypothetical protein [Kiritimatiellia bacterium]